MERRRLMMKKEEPREYEYVDLGLPSGLLWAKCNVGAQTETDDGLYFAWGETQGYAKPISGKSFSWSNYKWGRENNLTKYNTTDGKTVLDAEDDAARVNMGGSWRMPTQAEFQELINNTNSTWTTFGDISGRKFTSKINSSKYIFIPAAGYCYDGYRHNTKINGHVWSASLYSSYVASAWRLYFYSGGIGVNYDNRYIGCSVRGVLDNPPHLYYEINNNKYPRNGSLTGDCTAKDVELRFYWDGLDGTIGGALVAHGTLTVPSGVTYDVTGDGCTAVLHFPANESTNAYVLPKYTITFEYEGETVTFTYTQEADYIVDRSSTIEITSITRASGETASGLGGQFGSKSGTPAYTNFMWLVDRQSDSSDSQMYEYTYQYARCFGFRIECTYVLNSTDIYKSGRTSTTTGSPITDALYAMPYDYQVNIPDPNPYYGSSTREEFNWFCNISGAGDYNSYGLCKLYTSQGQLLAEGYIQNLDTYVYARNLKFYHTDANWIDISPSDYIPTWWNSKTQSDWNTNGILIEAGVHDQNQFKYPVKIYTRGTFEFNTVTGLVIDFMIGSGTNNVNDSTHWSYEYEIYGPNNTSVAYPSNYHSNYSDIYTHTYTGFN